MKKHFLLSALLALNSALALGHDLADCQPQNEAEILPAKSVDFFENVKNALLKDKYTDARDLIKYGTKNQAKFHTKIIAALQKNKQALDLVGVEFNNAGPGLSPATRENAIYGVELYDVQKGELPTDLNLTINYFYKKKGKYYLGTALMNYTVGNEQIQEVKMLSKKNGADLHPQLVIGLKEKSITLVDEGNGFKKIYPVAIGALDPQQVTKEGKMSRTLSALLPNAKLSAAESDAARTDPSIYAGRPFLRIINLDQAEYKGFTPYGLHYKITDKLQRGFISNGCFRMNDKDLYELAAFVIEQKKDIPLKVVMSNSDSVIHPYPMMKYANEPKVVKDASGNLRAVKDSHGYIDMMQSANLNP